MKELWNTTKLIFASIGAAIGWFEGGADSFIYALIMFTVVDYIFGVLRAIAEKKLSSRIGAKGIVKKVGMFLIVGMAHLADVYLLGEGGALRTAIVFFYCSNEGISLVENANVIGLPVPKVLKDALEKIKSKSDEPDDKPKNDKEDNDNGNS